MANRSFYSGLTEWGLKIFLVFFFASFFFQNFIHESLGTSEGFKMGYFVKIVIISIFGILISILEKKAFKIAAFSIIIIGSLFKILMVVSAENFNLTHIFETADYFLLIMISTYYLYRHFTMNKDKKKYRSSKSRHEGEGKNSNSISKPTTIDE